MAETTLNNVKAIARGDAFIQSLSDTDPLVVLILADVSRTVTEAVFQSDQEAAQRYLAAHLLSLSKQPSYGVGALSSESIGGVSQSFHAPLIGASDIKGLSSTQYGLTYARYRAKWVVPARFVQSSC